MLRSRVLLRGAVLNRTYGTHKNLLIFRYVYHQYVVLFTMVPRNKRVQVLDELVQEIYWLYQVSLFGGEEKLKPWISGGALCIHIFTTHLQKICRYTRNIVIYYLRGTIVNRTHGTHTKHCTFTYFYEKCLVLFTMVPRVNSRR